MATYGIYRNGQWYDEIYHNGHYIDQVYIGKQLVWEKFREDVLLITLSWGASPRDLDSHITGPQNSGGRFHVYYSNEEYSENGELIVDLDVDDRSGYGPEHTTIRKFVKGVYRFSVHDYTNRSSQKSTALSNSGAMVTVESNGRVIRTFQVSPGTPGTVWTVFEYENGKIKEINDYYYQSFPSDIV